jgi:hypothetical protein
VTMEASLSLNTRRVPRGAPSRLGCAAMTIEPPLPTGMPALEALRIAFATLRVEASERPSDVRVVVALAHVAAAVAALEAGHRAPFDPPELSTA